MVKRKPTMRDVAAIANVSVAAVSLAVRNKPGVGEETRERIREAIARLGYVVTDDQKNGQPSVVGLLIERRDVPAMVDIFYGEVARGFQSEAQRLGYQMMVQTFNRAEECFDHTYASLADAVQGIVIANDGDITNEMVVQALTMQRPLVLIETYIPGQQVPCVLGDNFVAGYTVMQHLLALGHRAVAVLHGPTQYSSLLDRLRGCRMAAAEAGILIPPEWIPPPLGGSYQRGYLQMSEILKLPERPTAVVAVHDKIAFSAMEAIREAGLRIPADIAIVSIDDVAESAYTRPPLTTFHIPRAEMGMLAMRKLHRLIIGEPELAVKSMVYGKLVVRDSCGLGISERDIAAGMSAKSGLAPSDVSPTTPHIDDGFSRWEIQQSQELHGMDFRQPPTGPLSELVIDSQAE